MNYSLQGNRKTEEGEDHPDRDAQFRHINRQVQLALRQGRPVISVDTKKKELIGNFHNAGQQWREKKSAGRGGGRAIFHPPLSPPPSLVPFTTVPHHPRFYLRKRN